MIEQIEKRHTYGYGDFCGHKKCLKKWSDCPPNKFWFIALIQNIRTNRVKINELIAISNKQEAQINERIAVNKMEREA